MKLSLTACVTTVALAIATPAFAQSTGQATTITGKVLDLATYMTHDHNMDAMHGDAMKGDAMKGDAMKGDAMKGDAMKGDAMKGDAMKGDAMKGDAMKGDAMKGDAMHGGKACPSLLGVVSQGKAYPLTFQMGSTTAGDDMFARRQHRYHEGFALPRERPHGLPRRLRELTALRRPRERYACKSDA